LESLVGDYTGDNTVNALDYVFWRDRLGQSAEPFTGADGDGSGTIDPGDYSAWRQHYGESIEPAATSAAFALPQESSETLAAAFAGESAVVEEISPATIDLGFARLVDDLLTIGVSGPNSTTSDENLGPTPLDESLLLTLTGPDAQDNAMVDWQSVDLALDEDDRAEGIELRFALDPAPLASSTTDLWPAIAGK
jgi:hypothetical protein